MTAQQTDDEQEKPASSGLVLDWEKAGKVGAAIVGLLYVVGLLTVNTYLYRIGAAEFSLLKAQYIYTGALTLAPILFCSLSPAYAYFVVRSPAFSKVLDSDPGRSGFQWSFLRLVASPYSRWFNGIVFALLPLVALVPFVDPAEGLPGRIWTSVQMYWVSAATGLIAFGLFVVLSAKQSAEKKHKSKVPKPVVAFGALVFFVGYTSWYLSLFTTHIYTNVPGQFGGGQPAMNRLVFFADKASVALDLGIQMPEGSTLSAPVSLLFETDKSYVVLVDGKRVVRLSKDLIAAVQVGG
jgi:hypothetical protein